MTAEVKSLKEYFKINEIFYEDLSNHLIACHLIILFFPKIAIDFPPNKDIVETIIKSLNQTTKGDPIDILESNNVDNNIEATFKILANGFCKINLIQIKNIDSFTKMFIYSRCVRNLYRMLSNQFLKETNDEIALISDVDFIGKQVLNLSSSLIGYWTAKMEQKKASIPGGQAKVEKYEERLKGVLNRVREKGNLTEGGLEIKKEDWHKTFEQVFEYRYPSVSSPTLTKYKKEIEKKISEEMGKETRVILKK
jgi:hypothetical protein